MQTSQIVLLGLALFLGPQIGAAHHLYHHRPHHQEPFTLGGGVDGCSACQEFVVRAPRPSRPVYYASPIAINEAAAAKLVSKGPGGCGALPQAQPQLRNEERELSASELLNLEPGQQGIIAPRFRPIGDLCTARSHKTAVLPAYPAQPAKVCLSCQAAALKSEGALSSQCTCGNTVNYSASNDLLNEFEVEDQGLSFDEQESIYNSRPAPHAPVDPVSLSLAYGLAQQVAKHVPEEKLSYGPRAKPIEDYRKRIIPDIPEERLVIVERPVVELKSVPRTHAAHSSSACSKHDEDVAEQEAMEAAFEAEADVNEATGALISYSDLGFAPVGSKPQATDYSNSATLSGGEDAAQAGCGPLGPPAPGYKSGGVILPGSIPADEDLDDYYRGSHEEGISSEEDGAEYESGLLARLRARAHSQNGRCSCGCS